MAKAWQDFGVDPAVSSSASAPHDHAERQLDWRKRMSDNIAYALLVYTGLQIFITMRALVNEGANLLPYIALVILVVAIIPSCRRFERRWGFCCRGG